MAHGPSQAIFGLGRPATNVPVNQPGVLDESEDNDLAAVVQDSANDGIIDAGAIATDAVDSAEIKADAVTKAELAGGFSKVSVVDGEDETSTHQITVTGMAVGDEVVAVLVLTTKASIATAALHAGTLTAAAGKITPGTEVDNTGNQYIIFWNDLT